MRILPVKSNTTGALLVMLLILVVGQSQANARSVFVETQRDVVVSTLSQQSQQGIGRSRSAIGATDGITLLRVNAVSFRNRVRQHLRGQRSGFDLPLPALDAARAEISDVVVAAQGRLSVHGRLVGHPLSRIHLSMDRDGRVNGSIRYQDDDGVDRRFVLKYEQSGDHALYEHSRSGFGDRRTRLAQRESEAYRVTPSLVREKLAATVSPRPRDAARFRAEDPSRIDLMVIYTREAARLMGGSVSLLDELRFSLAQTNRAFEDSGIDLSLRLVHQQRRAIAECTTRHSANCKPKLRFEQLISDDDGILDDIEEKRDEYGADLVMVIGAGDVLHGAGSVSSSLAARPLRNDLRGKVSGFSYLRADLLSDSDYSFARLIGRNLNALGSRSDYQGNGVEGRYNYGFIVKSGRYKTIMAIDSKGVCAARGYPGCSTVGYFSNPRIRFGGERLGVMDRNAKRAADNATSIAQLAQRVASYRITKVIDRPSIVAPDTARMVEDRLGLENQSTCEEKIGLYTLLAERDIEDCEGAMISSVNPVISFNANGTNVEKWRLKIGRSMYDSDYFNSGELQADVKQVVINRLLPEDNRTISVRLEYLADNDWQKRYYFFRPYRPAQIEIYEQAMWIQTIVARLSPPLVAGWQAHRELFNSSERLADAAIDRDYFAVSRRMNDLYTRVDGCVGADAMMDENDYLTRCADQLDVLQALDEIQSTTATLEPPLRTGRIIGLGSFCLHASSSEALSPVQIMRCTDGEQGQQWQQTEEAEMRVFGNMCLEVQPVLGREAIDGTPVRINYCAPEDEQVRPHHQWSFNTGGHILDPYYNKCLDITDAELVNGTEIQIFECVGVPHQRWWLQGTN